jgi:undecaprenyl diphosphate synthase
LGAGRFHLGGLHPIHPRALAWKPLKSDVEASSLYSSGTLRIHELTAEERAIYATLKPERLPEHVAIIMDGNGRWAGHRSLKRFLGHQQGAKSVQLVTETASRIGLPWLTLYAFSLEKQSPPPPRGGQLPDAAAEKLPGKQPAANDGQQRAHALHRPYP